MKRIIKILFFIILYIAITYTSISVKAENPVCEPLKRKYLFSESVTSERTPSEGTGDKESVYPTYFLDELENIEGAQFSDVVIRDVKPMTQSDWNIYSLMIKDGLKQNGGVYCEKLGTGQGGAPICKYGEYRTNAGTEEFTVDYWNNNVVLPKSIQIWCGGELNGNALGHSATRVNCAIKRTWNELYSQHYSGRGTYSVPAVAEIEIYYTAPNCTPQAFEEKNEFNCSTGGDIAKKDPITVSATRTIYETDAAHNHYEEYTDDKKDCSTELEQTITADVEIRQKTYTYKFPNFTENNIYAGGGFGFSFEYQSYAEYNLNSLKYTITEQVPIYYCPTIPYEYEIYEINNYNNGVLFDENGTQRCDYNRDIEKYYVFSVEKYNESSEYYNSLCGGSTIYNRFRKNDNKMYCLAGQYNPRETREAENGNCTPFSFEIKQVIKYDQDVEPNASQQCSYDMIGERTITFSSNDYNQHTSIYNSLCSSGDGYIRTSGSSNRWCKINNNEPNYVGTAKHDANQCKPQTSEEKDCSSAYGGCESSEEKKLIAQKMAAKITNPNLNNENFISIDTNTGTQTYVLGTWQEDDSELQINEWYPGNRINYSAKFQLATACIGLGDNSTTKAPVMYITSGPCEVPNINLGQMSGAMYGGELYYTPLKWEDGTPFPVSVNIDNISIVDGMIWESKHTCPINVYQKMYDDSQYKFIYRPISLDNPFPGAPVTRVIGKNWISFMQDYNNNNSYAKNKLTRSNNNLEYNINLTQQKIIEIKNYNNYTYPSLNSISKIGRSKALEKFDITGTGNNEYNDLGYCSYSGNTKCWLSQ